MKVTYIYHSGFAVELAEHIFLFDYFKGSIPEFDRNKKLIVCASHFHQDHYSREIWNLRGKYHNIQYIMARDIRRLVPKEEQLGDIIFMKKRDSFEGEGFRIQTLRSTDEGSAFLVECEGETIYHAGDLNWWHWEEESDKYNAVMKRAYQDEVAVLKDREISAAFVVLDPRQEEQFFWGLDWFMRHTETKHVFPMHMWDKYEVYDWLMEKEESAPYRDKVIRIDREGQTFEL